MSLKDKLEIGLKPDAPFRPDNLPDFQKDDPACQVAATPGDTPSLRQARAECEAPPFVARQGDRRTGMEPGVRRRGARQVDRREGERRRAM
jgi:hypothetical protein